MSEIPAMHLGGGMKVYTEADCTVTTSSTDAALKILHFPDGITWDKIKHFVMAGLSVQGTSGRTINLAKNEVTGELGQYLVINGASRFYVWTDPQTGAAINGSDTSIKFVQSVSFNFNLLIEV